MAGDWNDSLHPRRSDGKFGHGAVAKRMTDVAVKARGKVPADVESKPDVKASKLAAPRPAVPAGEKQLYPELPEQPLLSDEHYKLLKPSEGHYADADARWEAKYQLEQTQAGKDLIEAARAFQDSFVGCARLQDDVWRVLNNKPEKVDGTPISKESRIREAQVLVNVSRHVPQEILPPKLHRGVAVDDLDGFLADHQPGSEIEFGPSSFTTSPNIAGAFAKDKDNGKHPVLIEFDTSKGAQAIPLEQIGHDNAWEMHEYITMGRFHVTEQTKDRYGNTVIRIAQTGMY